MFVLPEPLGPTIAVTPPSNRISVVRANVLKPSSCSERRNKGRFTVADVVGIPLSTSDGLVASLQLSELPAGRRLRDLRSRVV